VRPWHFEVRGFPLLEAFSTKGAEKRKQHGSKGSHVFRDPNDDTRAWVVFDWDEEGFQRFLSDPDVPAIFQEGGSTVGPSWRSLPGSTTPREHTYPPPAWRRSLYPQASALEAVRPRE
jgi:hypothetical protein